MAALIVLLHHVALIAPLFALTYQSPELAETGSLAWWFAYTPLKILTAGPEAVIVFFLLSGFVLALEPLRNTDFAWVAYFPRRIVRLSVPIVASVALAVLLILLVPREPSRASSGWVAMLANPSLRSSSVIGEATVIFHGPLFPINGPLWSLVWEMWFSLLLPLAVAIVVLVPRAWWAVAIASVGLSWVGQQYQWPALQFLPMFLIGAAMAAGVSALRRVAAWISARRFSSILWLGLLAVGILLLIAGWIARGAGVIDTPMAASLSPEKIIGAAIIVFGCTFSTSASRALTTRVPTWLGRISFSLYLVHMPILLAFAFGLGVANWLWAGILAVPTSLLAAWAFAKLIEVPAHRLSRRVGDLVTSRGGWRPSVVE